MSATRARTWRCCGSGRRRASAGTWDHHHFRGAFDAAEAVLRREQPDFPEIDYSLEDREAERRLIPAAAEVGAAVLTALPFGRGRLFRAVQRRPLPEWAREFGAATWGQFFLKYLLGNPAVTVVIPGTGSAEHMADNLGAGRGTHAGCGTTAADDRVFCLARLRFRPATPPYASAPLRMARLREPMMTAHVAIAATRRDLFRSVAGATTLLALAASPRAGAAQAAPPLKIGMIGAGRMGGTLGSLWVKAGHPVMFSTRHPEQLKDFVAGLGPLARAGTPAEAIAFADVVLLVVPYAAEKQIGQDFGPGSPPRCWCSTSATRSCRATARSAPGLATRAPLSPPRN